MNNKLLISDTKKELVKRLEQMGFDYQKPDIDAVFDILMDMSKCEYTDGEYNSDTELLWAVAPYKTEDTECTLAIQFNVKDSDEEHIYSDILVVKMIYSDKYVKNTGECKFIYSGTFKNESKFADKVKKNKVYNEIKNKTVKKVIIDVEEL